MEADRDTFALRMIFAMMLKICVAIHMLVSTCERD